MSASFFSDAGCNWAMAHSYFFWWLVFGAELFGVASQHKHKRAGKTG